MTSYLVVALTWYKLKIFIQMLRNGGRGSGPDQITYLVAW